MKGRPSAVRIIGKTYGISYVNGKPLDDDDLGEFDPFKQRISVRESQPLEQEQDTVLHEVIHAISHEADINLQEKQVRPLATILLGILKDNERLVSYLRKRK